MMETEILTLAQVQKIELGIMVDLHEYLVAQKLRYCLGYGTLLGAVRHKGFIPWDNDMDILMPRPDFERFLELIKTEPIQPHLKVFHYTTHTKYHYQAIRVCDMRTKIAPKYLREMPDMGVWVDIFVVDGVPEKQGINEIKLEFWKKIQLIEVYQRDKTKPLKYFIRTVVPIVFPNKNQLHECLIDQYARKHDFDTCTFVADTVERNAHLNCLSKKDFDYPNKMEFCSYSFFVPQNSDIYLKSAYGDYMQIPPPEKRVTHPINATFREESRDEQI